ncbi:hypothetical protein L2E82_15995 [Cichorium intybus]|uniref:Uncharacterized protein n=1 Tax=Cichorium intybus TaxID=13427 RepID=A0ACB9F5A4_CICIN|nr:hypothetical protein L2E82_15995 [Cichorium intybus]
MNGRGTCCIARHDGGGGGGMHSMSKVARIMLKYRPIAPKPVAAGSASGGSTMENSDGYVKCRSKRKYVKGNGNKKKNSNSRRCSSENKKVTASSCQPPPSSKGDALVTLSLLPETPDRKENPPVTGFTDLLSSAHINKCNCSNNKKAAPAPVWLSLDSKEQKVCYGDAGGFHPVVVKPPPLSRRLQLVSYVTVESVIETSVDGEGIGRTDVERVMNMEMDSCPGFISDSQDRVMWTNKAFRQMVGAGHVIGGEDMAVVLVRKDNWTPSPVSYPTFTCKVRVNSATHSDHRSAPSPLSPTRTLPCDVWRMERGACAWRLDVKAALSLGR